MALPGISGLDISSVAIGYFHPRIRVVILEAYAFYQAVEGTGIALFPFGIRLRHVAFGLDNNVVNCEEVAVAVNAAIL